MKKPTNDKELLEYQKEVCCNCAHQIDLVRGRFTKGCGPVDLHGMSDYPHMIKEDGTCMFLKDKVEQDIDFKRAWRTLKAESGYRPCESPLEKDVTLKDLMNRMEARVALESKRNLVENFPK
jgi:hypothetical protein